jgi:iron complex transport system substrate-binding protein
MGTHDPIRACVDRYTGKPVPDGQQGATRSKRQIVAPVTVPASRVRLTGFYARWRPGVAWARRLDTASDHPSSHGAPRTPDHHLFAALPRRVFDAGVPAPSMRVVSLLPSATEIVYALGVEPVGVSHECDFPPAAREVPAVNRSRVDPDASSAEIDEQVEAAMAEGGVYEIDRDRLAALDPDVVVSQGICDVCAVDEVAVRAAVDDLGLDAAVLTTDPHSLADVMTDIERIGAALGRGARASEVVADLRERVAAVEETAKNARERPQVAVLDWLDPPMVAGHWVPGMVETAGGRYGLADPGDRSRPREWDAIRAYDPDVLVASPCGFDLDQTAANLTDLTGREGWADLTAVREDRVYAVDGHHHLNRPGPRLVDALAFLGGLLHPDCFADPPADAVKPLPALAGDTEAGALQ